MPLPLDDLVPGLTALLGADDVIADREIVAGFEIDWTRRWSGHCDAVVQPRDTAAVATVVAWCRTHGVAVVPQGGNTGLVGGGIPPARSDTPVVVLTTRRLDTIDTVDDVTGQITVGAGVTLGALSAQLAVSGWDVPVDLAARDTATIGGMAATNAGGVRVVRHGMMRRNVVGLEVVLADGSIVSDLRGLDKDNTGYDLTGLMVGSEGTLGVITRVRLRLVPTRTERVTVLIRCADWSDAVAIARDMRRLDGVEALEAVDAPTAALVPDVAAFDGPLVDHQVALLAEWAGDGEPPAAFVSIVGDRVHHVATDSPGRAALWSLRDHATESIARLGVPHKFDVTLPLDRVADFTDAVADVTGSRGLRSFVFGHVGDGNLHVNVLGPASEDTSIDQAVLELVADLGGSISAEHGIGRMKQPYLPLARSSVAIAAFGAIKRALDPTGTMNPGVLLGDV